MVTPPRHASVKTGLETDSRNPAQLFAQARHVSHEPVRLPCPGGQAAIVDSSAQSRLKCANETLDAPALSGGEIDRALEATVQQCGKCIPEVFNVEKIPHLS